MPMPHRNSLQTSIGIERDHFRVELNSQKVEYAALLKENERLKSVITAKDTQISKQKQLTVDLQRSTQQSTRTINALNKELRAAEASEKTAKEYTRSVERKIVRSCPKELIDKYGKLKERLNHTNDLLTKRDDEYNAQHEQLEKAEKEIRVLLRALEIRTDELSLGGNNLQFEAREGYQRGAEVRESLLYELSAAQEQSSELEMELEKSISKNEQLKLDYSSLLGRYEAEQRLRTKADIQIQELQKKLDRHQEDCNEILTEKESVEKDLQGTYKTIEKHAEVIASLEAKVEELSRKLKSAESEDQKTENHERVQLLSEKIRELSANYSQKVLVANQAHSRSIEEHRRALSAEQALSDLKQGAEEDRASCEKACIELREQKQLTEKYMSRLKVAIEEIEEVRHKLGILEHELGEERSQHLLKHSEAEKVSKDHSIALSQLEAIKSELQVAESSKVHLASTAHSEASTVSQLRDQIEQISKSKELLQRAMLEQLSHARRELREERERNSQKHLPPQFSRKLEVLASETGRLHQLLHQPLQSPPYQTIDTVASPGATVSLSSLAGLG